MQFGGLGQLCDGVLGEDDFIQTKELRVWPGYDYLGWSREALGQGSVDIEFDFEKPRLFNTMQVGTESSTLRVVHLTKNSSSRVTVVGRIHLNLLCIFTLRFKAVTFSFDLLKRS